MQPTGETLKTTVAGEAVATFVPYPLPPRNPARNVDGQLATPLRRNEQAIAHAGAEPMTVSPPRLVASVMGARLANLDRV